MLSLKMFGSIIIATLSAVTVVCTQAEPHKAAPASRAVSAEKAQQLAPQATCPIMGGAINKNLFVDYKGKRIYVCCAGCLGELKKDPEKYLKKLHEMGQEAETIKNGPEQTGK